MAQEKELDQVDQWLKRGSGNVTRHSCISLSTCPHSERGHCFTHVTNCMGGDMQPDLPDFSHILLKNMARRLGTRQLEVQSTCRVEQLPPSSPPLTSAILILAQLALVSKVQFIL